MTVEYDPYDTVHWMLREARTEVLADTAVGPSGQVRRKAKARRELERVRYETLCEVIWNVTGRPAPLGDLAEDLLRAA